MPIVVAAGAWACSTLAGFDDLTGSREDDAGSGAPSGATAGTNSGAGGARGGGSGRGGDGTGGPSNGGSSDATGGAGMPNGGVSNGGTANGGTANGGTSNGGTANGGAAGTMNAGRGGATAGSTSAGTGGASAGSAPTGGKGGAGGASGGNGPTGGTAGSAAGSGGTGGTPGCNGQMLVNGNFSAGRGNAWMEWSNYSAGPLIVHRTNSGLTSRGVTPQSDDYLAWVGGDPDNGIDHYLHLWQDITIPQDVTSMTVTGFVWVLTTEPEQDAQYDRALIELREPTTLAERFTFRSWSNLDTGSGWQMITNVDTPDEDDLDTLRGQTLSFIVHSTTDESFATHFWFDSLVFDVRCGR